MTELNGVELINAVELYGEEMPQPSEYLSAKQRDGRPLGADEIFRETWIWLKERGCEKLVNPRLIESYAQSFARFILYSRMAVNSLTFFLRQTCQTRKASR